MALDLARAGALAEKRDYRHASTHRFSVLHDIVCKPSRDCAYVEHHAIEEFAAGLIESLSWPAQLSCISSK
jgi:hypothetical protein